MAIQLPARTRQWFTGEDKRETIVVLVPGAAASNVAKALTANPAMTLTELQAAIAACGATPENITGWTLSWMVKRHKTDDDNEALITKTSGGGGITLVTPLQGVCRVQVDDDDIVDIPAGIQYWEEWKRVDDGFRTVLMQAPFILGQAVHDNEVGS